MFLQIAPFARHFAQTPAKATLRFTPLGAKAVTQSAIASASFVTIRLRTWQKIKPVLQP